MSSSIIVLSPDNIRGSILEKILSRSGFDVSWFKSHYEAEEILKKNAPRVVILDAKGLRSRAMKLVEKLRNSLPDTVIIALVDSGAVPASGVEGSARELLLPEPFDPELIVARVREIVSSPPDERDSDGEPGKDVFTTSLKQFLKLD